MKGITKKIFFDFATEISQKSFLGICHAPPDITWDWMVQIF